MAWRNLDLVFRQSFHFPTSATSWFPGHMDRGLRQMQRSLKDADLIVEVHDARIPLSGRNVNFRNHITGSLPHVLVLNKKDLVPASDVGVITKALKMRDPHLRHVIFTNCKDSHCKGISQVLPTAIKLIKSSERFHRSDVPSSNILVIGIPNVGKSSLINILRNRQLKVGGKATTVGSMPGVTRSVLTKIRVNNDPLVYLIDTPGIMMPNIKDKDIGMKLTLCATIRDQSAGVINIADYLLFVLNKNSNFSYVSVMKLDRPYDNVQEFLKMSSMSLEFVKPMKNLNTGLVENYPDTDRVCQYFLKKFREGKFGTINLDEEKLNLSQLRARKHSTLNI